MTKFFQPFLSIAITGLALAAGPPNQDSRRFAADAARRQRLAIAAMRASLDAQRNSVRAQSAQKAATHFFLLAPLSTLGRSGGWTAAPCPPLPDSKIDALVESAANRESLEPALLRIVALNESGFRPCAVSPKGALGLMQLMPATAAQLGVRNPFDPAENISAGARLLRDLLDRFGELPLALSAYNAGVGRVRDAGGIPNIPETRNYVRTILAAYPLRQDH